MDITNQPLRLVDGPLTEGLWDTPLDTAVDSCWCETRAEDFSGTVDGAFQ